MCLDLPMTFQWERMATGMPFGWDESYGARLGVMRQDDPAGAVTWFDVDPCYVFHVGGAHTDDDGRVVVDGARYAPADVGVMWGGPVPRRPRGGRGGDGRGPDAPLGARPARRLGDRDGARGAGRRVPDDRRGAGGPPVALALRRRRRGAGGERAGAVVKVDSDGTLTAHELGPDVVAGEAVFVASQAPGRAEDDGWLLTITTRRDGAASQLLVLDATDVGGPPVAAVTLPRGVPSGFHGSWIPDPT